MSMEPWKPLSFKEFDTLEKEPLDRKVERAVAVIREAVNLSKHQMAVAFSGGKDSTVLLHLISRHFPELRPWVIFANTGIEYPESLRFARQMGKELAGERYVEALPDKLEEDGLKYQAQKEVLEWLVQAGRVSEVLKEDGKLKSTRALEQAATPEMWEDFRRRNLVWRKGMRKSFWWCCDQYGFPLLGKSKSKLDARRINIDCFLRFSASESESPELLEYYRLLRNVKISQHCCKELKKAPSERAQAEHDVDVIFKGLMGTESRTRKISFITRGYIIQSRREHLPSTDPFWHVSPMATWTDADVWAYIRAHQVPYSPLYDMGYKDSRGTEHRIARNGCMGCATGIAFADNSIAMLRRTHPKAWEAVMRAGMAEQLRTLRQFRADGSMSLLDLMPVEDVMEMRPCAFDTVSRLTLADDTFREYDADAWEDEEA